MTFKKHLFIALTALALLTTGAVASAQTTTTTDTTGVTTTAVPGTPNTGEGGNASANITMLAASGAIVVGGISYLLLRRKSQQSDAR